MWLPRSEERERERERERETEREREGERNSEGRGRGRKGQSECIWTNKSIPLSRKMDELDKTRKLY